jgi:hypothetical protein
MRSYLSPLLSPIRAPAAPSTRVVFFVFGPWLASRVVQLGSVSILFRCWFAQAAVTGIAALLSPLRRRSALRGLAAANRALARKLVAREHAMSAELYGALRSSALGECSGAATCGIAASDIHSYEVRVKGSGALGSIGTSSVRPSDV